MATEFNFNGKLIKLPGSYATVSSGVNNPPLSLSYGNVLIIDKDDSSLFGGGAGIKGELADGKDAIYGFDNIRDFRKFVGGGDLWDLAKPLFRPNGPGYPGVSILWYVRALETTAGSLTLNLTNGNVVLKTKHEGIVANGVVQSGVLTQGFAVTLETGTIDPNKFRFKFWRSGYKGVDENNILYDGISATDSQAILVAASPEISTIDEFVEWATIDYDFNNNFKLISGSGGAITSADVTSLAGYQLFSGATQTYSTDRIDEVLDAVKTLDYSNILSMDSEADAVSVDNLKILAHLHQEARFDKTIVIAGGNDRNTFHSQSIAAANTLNSEKAVLVHAGCIENDVNVGERYKNSKYHAAYVLGRVAGLPPQTPPTFKALAYAGERHKMNDKELTLALDNGVLTTHYDDDLKSFVITQGITTLKNNKNVVNPDGTSHSWQLMRIAAQLNKEIIVNAKIDLLGNQHQGPNRATISPEVVAEWTKSYLKKRTATSTQDNLILSFQDVTVEIKQDAYCIDYGFVPNFEVNKLFFTGLILDPNL